MNNGDGTAADRDSRNMAGLYSGRDWGILGRFVDSEEGVNKDNSETRWRREITVHVDKTKEED